MKIEIQEDSALTETEVVIRCRHTDAQVLKMLASLRAYDQKITGTRDGQTYPLETEDILYIDTVDKKTFFYTRSEVYETQLRLYELEDRLAACDFFRASKSAVVNFNEIQSLRPDFGGRMQLTMTNGEVLFASRQYVPVIKQKLGLN